MGKTFTSSTETKKTQSIFKESNNKPKEDTGEKGYTKFTTEQKKRFGKNLRELRKKEGLTQKEIANKLDIGVSTYANYEQGISMPAPYIQKKLACHLKTTVLTLVYGYADDDATKFMEYTKGCTDKERAFILKAVKNMAISFYEMNYE